MKFSKITAISISPDAKPIFESFNKLKPDNVSFSMFLSIALEEYVQNRKHLKYPKLMDCMHVWNECLKDLTTDELLKVNNRVTKQLANRVKKELHSRL